jgi:hypothetical protein
VTDKTITNTLKENESVQVTGDAEKPKQIDEIIKTLSKGKADAESRGDNSTAMMCGSMITMAALLATYSPNAEAADLNALIEKFAEKISEQLKEQLGPMFESIMGIFMDGWGAVMNQEGDKTTEGLAKVGDSINQVNTTIEKERLKRATAPRYDGCKFDENAENELKAKQTAETTHKERMKRSTGQYFKSDNSSETSNSSIKFGTILTSSTATPEQKKALLDPEVLSKDVMSPQDVTNAENTIELLTVAAKSDIRPIVINDDSSYETRMLSAKSASKAIHIELAKNTLLQDVAKRQLDPQSGESEYSLLKSQIDNTYYSTDWRKTVQGYADPTPVLIDSCIQAATTNKILFDLLKGQQDQNRLQSAILLKMNERS